MEGNYYFFFHKNIYINVKLEKLKLHKFLLQIYIVGRIKQQPVAMWQQKSGLLQFTFFSAHLMEGRWNHLRWKKNVSLRYCEHTTALELFLSVQPSLEWRGLFVWVMLVQCHRLFFCLALTSPTVLWNCCMFRRCHVILCNPWWYFLCFFFWIIHCPNNTTF